MTLSHCHPDAVHQPNTCDLCDFYEVRFKDKNYQFPHCDAYVVHEPGACTYCDAYVSDIQKWRQDNGVNFTGEDDPNKKPCPATVRRKADKIHQWYGNVPQPETCPKCGGKATYINLALACPKHGPI